MQHSDKKEDEIREIRTPVHLKIDWTSWGVNALCWISLLVIIWVVLS